MEHLGRALEYFIPIWGPARGAAQAFGGMTATSLKAQRPKLEDATSMLDTLKDIVSAGPVKTDGLGGKTMSFRIAFPKSTKPVNLTIRIPKVTSTRTSKAPTGSKPTARPNKISQEGAGDPGKPKVDQKGGTQDAPKATTADAPATQPRKTVESPTQAGWKNFRANRGGDALKTTALSYKKFDQDNYSAFKPSNPDGVCQGLSLEAIKRIDRGSASGQDLSSAVLDIRRGLGKHGPERKALMVSIVGQQWNPKLTAFQNLNQQPTKRYDADRQMSINALENDIRGMAPGDVALLRTKIRGKHGEMLDTGHMLVVQRTKDQQYQLFDSNNGVFKYGNEDTLSKGLEPYFDTAYSDKGVMAPDSFTLYKADAAAAKDKTKAPEAPDGQKPFGENYDFPYADADDASGPKPATPQSGTGKPATDQPATPAGTPASSPDGGSTGPDVRTDKASEPKPATSQTSTGKPATDQPATPSGTPASSPASGSTVPEVRLNAGNVTSELPGLTAQGHLNAARYFTENGNPPLVIQDKQDVAALTRFFNEEGGRLRLLGGAPGGDGPSQPKRTRTEANDGQQPSTSTTHANDGQQPSTSRTDANDGQQPSTSTTNANDGQQPSTSTTHANDGQQPSTSTTNANDGQQPAAPSFTGGGIYGGFYVSDQLKSRILATVRGNQRLADSTVATIHKIPTRVVTDLRDSFNLRRTSGRAISLADDTRTQIKNAINQPGGATDIDIATRFDVPKSLVETIRQEVGLPKVTGISDQRKAEIVEYIRKNIGDSNDDIGKACGVSGMTISRLRHDNGLQKSSGMGVPLTTERKMEIRDYMQKNPHLINAQIGTRFEVSITTVSRIRNDPGYVEAPLPVPSPLPAGLDLNAPLSPNSQKKVDEIKAGLDSTLPSPQPGTSGGSSAPAQSSSPSAFAQNVDADAPLPELRERDLQQVWNELGWVNPDEPTNPDLMRWISKNLPPEELHRLADLPDPQVEGELGMIRRRANMPEEGAPLTPVATPSGSPSSTSSGSSTPSTQGSADAPQSPAREQQRAELENRVASSPTPPPDADAVITWLQNHRTPEEMKRIEKLPQDEFDAEIDRARTEMLAAQKQDAAPGPSGSGGVTNLNLQLTTDNVIRELPGLTPQGQQNAMNYLAPAARNPVPVLQNQRDIDNVTAFFNEGRSRPGLPGGDPASAGPSGPRRQSPETVAGQSQPSGSGTGDAVRQGQSSSTNAAASEGPSTSANSEASQGPSTSTNAAASQGSSTSTNTTAAPATQTSQSTSTVPNPEVITPSAGSLHERDLQVKKEVEQNHIPDPASPDYSAHIDDVVSKTSGETGVVKVDLPVLQKMAYKYNTIISIRPVDKYATGLIEEGYETKGFHIKGKSASWGPQAGLICSDQKFSKLENTDSARIDKFNQEITKSINGGDATKIPLELSWDRLQKLSDMGTITVVSEPNSKGVRTFGAVAPSGKLYYFEATPTKNGNFTITSNNQPIEVLAPTTKGAKPFTADYDLFAVAPHLADVGPQDRVPTPDVHQDVFKKRVDNYQNKDGINPNLKPAYDDKKEFHKNDDPDLGNSSQRVANLVPAINDEIKANDSRERANVAHHADDSTNPVTDQDANYPATFFLPYKMGRFDEICVIHDKAELKEMIQAAKDRGYNFPLNPLWDSDITDTRRKGFSDAQDNLSGSGGGSGTGKTDQQGTASGSGGDGSGTGKTGQENTSGSGADGSGTGNTDQEKA
ncbi:anthrax toxin-like adenylyl cyclase domain-containing protein [Paraburkholderia adhaesiva]|uniref:anthrax toxin-like adenylyl cyclase domain-containing protein n=1 Tax=Paraburkholderia adhaesiva TaxID=2883244 RepID=UPI001F1D40B3|nr:anthrax toxin-like adenylyl cyclase domain-containing protein [Paraburkholderia adhaesiva]